MRSRHWWLLASLILVCGIHAEHLRVFRFYPYLGRDSLGYVQVSSWIWGWPAVAIYYQPAYPLLLRILQAFLGFGPAMTTALVGLQVAMLAAAALLAGALISEATARPSLGVLAAMLVALDCRLTLHGFLILTEAMAVFLVSLWLYANYRCVQDQSWPWASCAALSLLALGLTRAAYMPLIPICAGVSFLIWLWHRGSGQDLRRYGAVMAIASLVVLAKWTVSCHYIGVPTGNVGINLVRVLAMQPRLLRGAPAGDPVAAHYRAEGNLEALLFSQDWTREFNRSVARSYASAVLRHPALLVELSVWSLLRQIAVDRVAPYPDDANALLLEAGDHPLLAGERWLASLLSAPVTGPLLFFLPVIGACVALFVRSVPVGVRRLLLLSATFTIYSVVTSTCGFAEIHPSDSVRVRVMYDLPLLLSWIGLFAGGLPAAVAGKTRSRAAASDDCTRPSSPPGGFFGPPKTRTTSLKYRVEKPLLHSQDTPHSQLSRQKAHARSLFWSHLSRQTTALLRRVLWPGMQNALPPV
jgi:hypothetical protein